ncbi:MAG: endonuclease III domain-containing protein [Nanobdellota archaeon]
MDIEKIYSKIGKEIKKYDTPVAEFVKAQTKDPEKILIATMLSSRTKDGTTAKISERLFSEIDSIKDLDSLPEDKIAELIYPVGFYKQKAKYLKKLPSKIDELGGIPRNIEGMTQLPGVGRKTANLVLSVAFGLPAICVDVHVQRILNRLGYIRTKDPLETEMRLRKKLPKKLWIKTNRIFVPFGQVICRPVSPFCNRCIVNEHCRKIGVRRSR